MLSYYEQVYRDVEQWLSYDMPSDFIDGLVPTMAIDKVYDALMTDGWSDCVTGNASGSYDCDAYKAMKTVLDNISDVAKAYKDLEMDKEFCNDLYSERWEKLDVIARIGNLYQAVNDAVIDYIDSKND